MFALTALFQTIILGCFSFAFLLVDFYDAESPDITYPDRVDTGIEWLMLIYGFPLLTVGFVLGGEGPTKLVSASTTNPKEK